MTHSAANFPTGFVPRWLALVQDPASGAVAEGIDAEGRVERGGPRGTLTQARTVFALAHLYLATGDPRLREGAERVWHFLDSNLRDDDGGYHLAVAADGSPLADPASHIRNAYDQSFVLLALVTLEKAAPGLVPADRVTSLWRFIEGLTDADTGALWQDDRMARDGEVPGDLRGQNPQMHMLEAVLQAHEMTGDPVWMARAARYVTVAGEYLVDEDTGSLREWVGPAMEPLDSPEGRRREVGHQYEWAWLLHRYADFGGDPEARRLANRLRHFAESRGLRRDGGPMAGAPYDALDARGQVTEETHLLWPPTEAGKLYAALAAAGESGAADAARRMERLVFGAFFGSAPEIHWHNQLDGAGAPVWPRALSRLVYHVALFVTEGARAGLWPLAGSLQDDRIMQQEETS